MPKLSSIFSIENCYALLLAITPFVFFQSFSDPAQTPVFLFLNLICLLLQVCMLQAPKTERGDFVQNNSFLIILSLLVLLLWVGIQSAIIHHANTESYYELARTASIIVFFSSLTLFIDGRLQRLTKIVWGLAACSLIYLLMALYESLMMGRDFFDMQLSYQITGHLGHRNLMANYLALSMPLYAYILMTTQYRIARYFSGFVLFTITVFLIFLASRVGWIGLAGFLIGSAVWLLVSKTSIRWKIVAPVVGAALLLIAIPVFLIARDPHLSLNIRKKVSTFIDYKKELNPDSYTISERLALWKMSTSMAKNHLLAGVGPGQWKFNYPANGLIGTQAQSGRVLFQRPHNDLLWYLCEYGLIGLGLFMSVVLFACVYSTRQIRSDLSWQAYLAAIGIFVFLLICFFDFPKERPVHLYLLSFYLAIFAAFIPSIVQKNTSYRIRQKNLIVTLIVFTGCCCVYFSVRALGEYQLNQALAYRMMGRRTEMREAFNHCQHHLVEYDLTGTPIEFYYGEADFYESNPNGAIDYFHRSLEKNPYHLYSWSDMGGCYWVQKKTDQAYDCWDKAIKIAPDFGEARINKSTALFQQHQSKAAAENLKFNLVPDDSASYRKQIIIIYGTYIKQLSDSVEEPILHEQLRKIVVNDNWILDLHKRMTQSKDSPSKAAIDESLWALDKMDHKISPSERVSLEKKYLYLRQ